MKNSGISVFLAAYNEEKNIEEAVGSVKKALKGISDYEIIIVNDGSADETGNICGRLRTKDKKIEVVNHKANRGLGSAFLSGLKKARMEYFTIFPGDNDMDWRSLRLIISKAGEADLITGYIAEDESRSRKRKALSRLYVIIMNFLFKLNLKYYNGPFIVRTNKLKSLCLRSKGMDILSEMTIRIIKGGASYMEVPVRHAGRKFGKSKAYSLNNLITVSVNTMRLFFSVNFPFLKSQNHS